jgi:hypothetical protein
VFSISSFMITHFNTIVVTCLDWNLWIKMRPYSWWVGFVLHIPLSAQSSSCLSEFEFDCFNTLWMRLFFKFNVFDASSKCLYFIKTFVVSVLSQIVLCFYCWYFTCSCNKIGILHWRFCYLRFWCSCWCHWSNIIPTIKSCH